MQKYQDFGGSKAFVSAIFEFVKFPTRYEWSNIKGTTSTSMADSGYRFEVKFWSP